MSTPPAIVLASGSPRRRELLTGLGLTFAVTPADIDETPEPGEMPDALVGRLSRAKASHVAAQRPDALVIAADTVVVLDGTILGKPRDLEENRSFIARLSGREHEVYTGHALALDGRSAAAIRMTRVRFRTLTDAEIRAYAATGEGLDKAGGYAIQGVGAALVPHIEGCYFNVVGLSVATVVTLAADLGVQLA